LPTSREFTAKKQPRQNDRTLNLFSSIVPKIIGPKGVYTYTGLTEFLALIKEVTAQIVVWSYGEVHRKGCCEVPLQWSARVVQNFGYESCGKIEILQDQYLRALTGSKEIS
jgi:hypothetical protein